MGVTCAFLELDSSTVCTCTIKKMESLLMQTTDSCFSPFGPCQCGVAPGVDQQLLLFDLHQTGLQVYK